MDNTNEMTQTTANIPATTTSTLVNADAVLDLANKISKLRGFLSIDMELTKNPHLLVRLQVGVNGPTLFLTSNDVNDWIASRVATLLEELESLGVDSRKILEPYANEMLRSVASSATEQNNQAG